MSGISAPTAIFPMCSGLEAFYRRQLKLHESEKLQGRVRKYGAVGAVMEFDNAECEEWNIEESVAVRRVVDAARLFSGRKIEKIDYEQVAISISGIVVFLNMMLKTGLPVDPELMGRCTVIPGHIEMHGRFYTHLKDFSDFELAGMDYRHRRGAGVGPDPLFGPSALIDNYEDIKLVAKESTDSVEVGLSFPEASGDRSVVLGPAILTERVLQATGLVTCLGNDCDRTMSVPTRAEFNGCVRMIDWQGQCEIWEFQGNPLGCLIALIRVSDNIISTYHQIFHNHECMKCCLAAAELSESQKAIIVTKRPSSYRKRLREE